MRKLPKTIDISGNQKYILVPYVNNPSEETIFGSNKIKEQCGTMKLQNEELSSETLKTLINELNRPGSQIVHISEKLLRKKLFVLGIFEK